MKRCCVCGIIKPESEFYLAKGRPIFRCKPCSVLAAKKWSNENKEKSNAAAREWRKRNKERHHAMVTAWDKAHPIEKLAQVKRYQKKYPERIRALQRKRDASKIGATPKWANLFFLEEAYDLARRRTKCTGFKWHVDHIVPLQSKLVCGLHSHTNIQVIPAIHNQKKNNKFWPDMP